MLEGLGAFELRANGAPGTLVLLLLLLLCHFNVDFMGIVNIIATIAIRIAMIVDIVMINFSLTITGAMTITNKDLYWSS